MTNNYYSNQIPQIPPSQSARGMYQQPLFPQPCGSLYSIENSLEVANIPS